MEVEAAYTLPSPTDTPYRTPSSSRSPRSHADDMSPSTTPPPLPEDRNAKRRSTDSLNPALDESISPLDPRRFTPTLHASLVSEILSLRRDMENKTNDIEQLEQSLHQAQQQNDSLNTSLLSSNKQIREVKRQMQLLEGGTLSAISDISSERDDALNDVTDLRRRLEQIQKRAKSQEDTAERSQVLWDKDKETWQYEKRGLETKVQIAEGRLKVVLSEIANAQQNARPVSPERKVESRNSILESPGKVRGRVRRHSATSVNSDHAGGRMSVLSFANGTTINLADELAFDEEEEDQLNNEFLETGRISPDALPEEQIRPASSLSIKARKVLGLPFDFEGEDHKDSVDPVKSENNTNRQSVYVDTAVQFSPPPSPWPRTETQQSRRSKPADLRFSDGRQSLPGYHAPSSPTESMDSRFAPWNYTGPIMVSSSCQTVEALPSPPLTPEKADGALSVIHESVNEVETKTIGTQTEPVQIKEQRSWQHVSTESSDLQIPHINIIPPTSRPVTPEVSAVVLPPRTKNAGAQVDLSQVGVYKSSSMQTEEIRVDRRNIVPPSQVPAAPPTNNFKAPISTRAVLPMRGRKPSPSNAMLASQRMNVGITRIPPTNDAGSTSRDFAAKPPPPVRSSSLYQGFDDSVDARDDRFDEDLFPEDDVFTRPTAKFTLRSGKLVSQDPVLEEIGESMAATAGEAAAYEQIRASEDSMAPSLKQILMKGRDTPPNPAQRPPVPSKSLRRVPSAKSNNMRRAALISSGSAAHKASNSASTNASHDSNNPPPFPVPLRYSSARIHKSVSEGGRSSRASSAASPTKTSRFKGKNILRKTRSGPAISPHAQARKSRSRSPPVSRVSIVPEMPTFQMPAEPPSFLAQPYTETREASAPRPSIATGPSRKTSHMKTNSDAVSMQQASVVDSIAQTMVGEWMYKYVRRRKSFGMTDKPDWDANKTLEEISANVTNNGVRHKRWVWLAPYERAVLWSSKQPTSGSALMGGKSGRKLTIKSVLDVKDDNPMPKGAVTGPHFNRSILILTPQRALKFTATSQERHFVWLTALSFLSHSPLSVNDLTAMPPPPPPPEDQLLGNPPPPSLAGSLRRRPIRDSIRIAKGSKPAGGLRSFTTDGSLPMSYDEYNSRPPSRDYYDPTQDAALPPTIKRFHSRKRSATAPKPPPSSFRGFVSGARDVVPPLPAPGNYAGTVSSSVIASTNGSDRGLYTPSLGVQSMTSSRRGSEASNNGRPSLPQVFADHSQMTMRMDAFAETKSTQQPYRQGPTNQFMPGGGPLPAIRGGTLKKREWGYWGFDDNRNSISPVDSLMHSEMMAAAESSARPSVDSRMTDPFRGF